MVGRIRVLVAGDIYVNPSLVRPFLEDDGYEVVADALTRADVLPAVSRLQPDAVVIDDRLLSGRRNGRLIQKVRRAAPDAKVVLVTAGIERAPGSAGVDASLEKGTSLAALSLVLGRLFVEDGSHLVPAAAGVGAAVGTTRVTSTVDARGGAMRFVVAVGAPLLVVWALIAMLATGGGAPLPPADTTDLAEQSVIVAQGSSPLDDAQSSLDRMLAAIEAGNYPLATAFAQDLMAQREVAIARGYVAALFDDQIRSALEGVAGPLPGYAVVSLQGVLGALFPELEDEQTPGGGSVIILGPVVGTGSGPGGSVTGGDGQATGGGDGGGGTVVTLGPGDGRDWGQSHKLTKGNDGPPPWSQGNVDGTNGHRGDPPGHDTDHGNGKGRGNGKGKGHGNGVGAGA
jgi:CheY-like chemotaxis protein